MKTLPLITLITLSTTIFAWSEPPYDTRLWTGTNGKSFRGQLMNISQDKTKLTIASAVDNKLVTVSLENLIPEDQEYVLKGKEKAQGENFTDFKPKPTIDRSSFPDYLPAQFGCQSEGYQINLIWQAFLWWHKTGFIQFDKKDDLDKTAQRLYKIVSRHFGENPRLEEVGTGMQKYFQTELQDVGTCRVKYEFRGFLTSDIHRYVDGPNLVFLKMTMDYKNGKRFSQPAYLSSLDETGKFVIHCYGKRFTGHFKELTPDEKKEVKCDDSIREKSTSELVIDNRADLPDYNSQQEPHFYLGVSGWDGVVVVKSYLYATPEKPVPLPPDLEWAPALVK